MCAVKLLDTVSVEEYLETAKTAPVKREYVHGRVFALNGTSDRHYRIVITSLKR